MGGQPGEDELTTPCQAMKTTYTRTYAQPPPPRNHRSNPHTSSQPLLRFASLIAVFHVRQASQGMRTTIKISPKGRSAH